MEQQVVLRTAEMQRIEAREGRSMDTLLRDLYLEQQFTVQEVADRLGVTKGAASRWLDRFGIDRRPTSWRKRAS